MLITPIKLSLINDSSEPSNRVLLHPVPEVSGFS